MKKRLLTLLLIPLALLTMAPSCGAKKETPVEQRPATLEEALAACGPDCHAIVFYIDLYDEDMKRVPLSDGFEAEVTLDALAIPTGTNDPVHVEVWDVTKSFRTVTPYTYETLLPFTDVQIASPDIVQISVEATVTVPAGWTLKCRTTENANGPTVSSDEITNNEGVDPDSDNVVGLPMDKKVFCSWPSPFDDIP